MALPVSIVDFASEKEIVVSDVEASVTNSTMVIDVRPWISYDDYDDAPLDTEWYFRVHVNLTDNNEFGYFYDINLERDKIDELTDYKINNFHEFLDLVNKLYSKKEYDKEKKQSQN